MRLKVPFHYKIDERQRADLVWEKTMEVLRNTRR